MGQRDKLSCGMPYSAVAMDAAEETPRATRPTLTVGVVMRRERVEGPMSRWQAWRWCLADVVGHDRLPALPPLTTEPGDPASAVPIEPDAPVGPEAAQASHWLFPHFPVTLYRDDAEGYYLNLGSPQPCFWVMWRQPEGGDDALPAPQVVTLSYHDAGRWLDAQERVDQVPAPPEVCAWLAEFVSAHYQPEPKRRQRPDSFQALTDRFGQPASVSTDQRRGPGAGGPRHG